ncbi:hypothetical protein Tco_0719551 [Tanacetum coccineum]
MEVYSSSDNGILLDIVDESCVTLALLNNSETFEGLWQRPRLFPSHPYPFIITDVISSTIAPNASSKTPSTKDTSSSAIDYIPKSPTSSTSLSPNGYLNSPTSPLPRVSPPPPTQENASMDITLTLSPITPLDVQFDTPSPSPPIFGHPIPWNLLEAHGDSCLCCIHNRTLIFGLRDELQYMFSFIEHMLSQPSTTIIPPPPPSSPN